MQGSGECIFPLLRQLTKMRRCQVRVTPSRYSCSGVIDAGRDQHRLHPDLLCAVDVGVEPVADHERLRWGQAKLRQRARSPTAPFRQSRRSVRRGQGLRQLIACRLGQGQGFIIMRVHRRR